MEKKRRVFDEDAGVIMRNAMKARGVTQVGLAEKMGMLQSSLSTRMTRQRISLESFRDILDALDFDIVIVDRDTGEEIWKVEVEK